MVSASVEESDPLVPMAMKTAQEEDATLIVTDQATLIKDQELGKTAEVDVYFTKFFIISFIYTLLVWFCDV